MILSRISCLTNKLNFMDINISTNSLVRIQGGASMVKVAPHLTLAECEFLNSGASPEEMGQITR